MLLLKANSELKPIFARLIKTMGVSVEWSEIFVITNDYLILAGRLRSFIFSFENKKVNTNILELPLEGQKIQELPEDALITNIFNMTLYAFGKWGSIKGVKVDKDYPVINLLFKKILKEIQIEPAFSNDNYYFYQEGIRITYEDVISIALKAINKEDTETVQMDENEEIVEEDYDLGLWHNMRWKNTTYKFEKQQFDEEDEARSRIGNNFYRISYICPFCQEGIYMTNCPEDKEILIETEEGRVYMAKIYACHSCHCFFTPRPGKLLREGEVYTLEFEEDQIAYEDYLEHLGKRGTKTPNYKLNEYEWERNRKKKKAREQEVSIDDNVNENNQNSRNKDKKNLKKQTETDHGIQKNHKDYSNVNNSSEMENLGEKPKLDNIQKEKEELKKEKTSELHEPKQNSVHKYDFSGKTTSELEGIIRRIERENARNAPVEKEENKDNMQNPEYLAAIGQIMERLKLKYDARMKVLGGMNARQLAHLKQQIQKEKRLLEEDIQNYLRIIDEVLNSKREKAEREKTVKETTRKEKREASNSNAVEEIKYDAEEKETSDKISKETGKEISKETLEKVRKKKKNEDKTENTDIENLTLNQSLYANKKQADFSSENNVNHNKINSKREQSQLEEKRDLEEKKQIAAYVKRFNKKDRQALHELYEQLKQQDFSKENVEPYLEKVYDAMVEIDQEEVDKICPDIMELTFEEGLAMYGEINEKMILPEIKTNTLEMIRRRLIKIKMDENLQLVRRLKKELERKIQDFSRIYFYEARRFQGQQNVDMDEKEVEIINSALEHYGAGRGEFEYPVLICDSSKQGNGKKGFILTPDSIYYKNSLNNGVISIFNIKDLSYLEGKIKKGFYVTTKFKEKKKLPDAFNKKIKKEFAKVLNEFVSYLQEKPESRSVDYLAKEKHVKKCCYRCGFYYEGGNICPKCGSKTNN